MHIVLAGGGAPGYWLPGLSVAHHIRAAARRAQITFLGTGQDFESRNATVAGFQYVPLWASSGAAGWVRAWRYLTDEVAAKRAARRYLKRQQPDVVVGLGGRASAPAVRAAIALGIPLVMLEYNALPGVVTKKYADRATVVFGAFPGLREQLEAAAPLQIVGNPIRPGFAEVFRLRRQAHQANGRASNFKPDHVRPRQLVVLAGTAGDGRALNESVPKALYKLSDLARPWRIVHQTGSRELNTTRLLYRKLGMQAEVTAFIPDMPRVLLHTDVAITRPGAITLSELAAATVSPLLVPSTKSSERHQAANAAAFVAAGAGRIVEEADAVRRLDDRLADALQALLIDGAARSQMSASIAELARPNAARHVASTVLHLAQSQALQNVA
jgi:UDP-N-acetylglucosamine--N-acetylmuramyl-(pentapeptide) pyrophosphoryl-undecaprenol N-acetylglucosamine transferase